MSDLVPSVLPLDKGLDLQTAKIIAPPGSVLDSLNYEQVDFQGQKRIEGYARYDGSALTAADEYYVIQVADLASPAEIGDILLKDGDVFGVVGLVDGETLYYLQVNSALKLTNNDAIEGAYSYPSFSRYTMTVMTSTSGRDSGASTTEHYDKLVQIMANLRTNVEPLPGRIAGLHWFQDRLYAVADTAFAVLSAGTTVYPNDVLVLQSPSGSSSVTATVLDASEIDAAQLLLLQATDINFGGMDVYRDGDYLGRTSEVDFPSDVTPVATIFESRTEQQVIDEDVTGEPDFGWRAKHLGWQVNFEKGVALYGKLAAVNQNRQNVGVQGPTSTAGTDGSPSGLFQKVNVAARPTQVNGWKSFDSPGAYVLDPSDIQQLDSLFIYADAFVSWNSDNSTVVAPGSDMNGLVEYSPTNSIVYTPFP